MASPAGVLEPPPHLHPDADSEPPPNRAQGEGSPRPQGARRGLGSGSRKPLTPDFFSFLREKKKKRFETEREELGEQTPVFVLT